jgi:hypothetical protein
VRPWRSKLSELPCGHVDPTPRRIRDRDHVKSVAKQPCLVCGGRPDHLRIAESPALGRKVSDEFTFRSAADTIVRSIAAVMKPPGGKEPASILPKLLAPFG